MTSDENALRAERRRTGGTARAGRRWLAAAVAAFVVVAAAVAGTSLIGRTGGGDAGRPAGSVPGDRPDDRPGTGTGPGAAPPPTPSTTGPGAGPGPSATPPTGGPVTPAPHAPPPPPPPPPPPSRAVEPAIVVRRGNESRREVALTFDAGSDTGHAAEILDVLRAEGVRATFGMTGRWADANPALVARMAAEGHQLVNHSYDHPSFTGRSTGAAPLSGAERQDQLRRADDAVRRAAGVTTAPWFRPPYGDEDATVRRDVALAGYRYELLWTVDSLGWRGTAPDAVARRCLDGAVPGAILLLHVGAESTDRAALPAIVAGLRQQGYGFTTAAGVVRP